MPQSHSALCGGIDSHDARKKVRSGANSIDMFDTVQPRNPGATLHFTGLVDHLSQNEVMSSQHCNQCELARDDFSKEQLAAPSETRICMACEAKDLPDPTPPPPFQHESPQQEQPPPQKQQQEQQPLRKQLCQSSSATLAARCLRFLRRKSARTGWK
jgi:hypothetical protein